MQGCLKVISSKEEQPLSPGQILVTKGAENLSQNTSQGPGQSPLKSSLQSK